MKSKSKTENAIEAADTRCDEIEPIDPWSNLASLPPDSADKARRARLIELSLGIRGMGGIADERSEGRMLSTLDRLANIGPQDAAESMLAELMVITHSAAIACASAAHDAGLGSPVASPQLVHLERLTAAYLAQMTTLDRHRGKASQQVIVKHVEVTKGGQAIVGHVDARNSPSETQRKHKERPSLGGSE
jgi:hypothetical protein